MSLRSVILSLASFLMLGSAVAAEPVLVLEAKIPLGAVEGRIDHFAVDLDGRRLFVAELGNDSVAVIDLQQGKVAQRLAGLLEPQGVGYVAGTLLVANARGGAVRFFAGTPLAPAGEIDLKDDADNVRVLPDGRTALVGYGSGGLAVIDVPARAKRGDIALKAHPESFQLDASGGRAFVNVPDAHEIAVVDLALGRQTASWTVLDLRANFPLARLDASGEIATVFRSPPRLVRLKVDAGAIVGNQETCGDADDVFHDARRDRLYVICGAGSVDVLGADGTGYVRLARVGTVSGARTGLFVPALDRLFVAIRARGAEPAAIWVFRPA